MEIGIQGQAIAGGADTIVTWSRNSGDPKSFKIVKVKLDEKSPQTSNPFPVTADSDSGVLTIPFIQSGLFNLIALDGKQPVATATQFDVVAVSVVTTTSTQTFTADPTSTAGAPTGANAGSTASNPAGSLETSASPPTTDSSKFNAPIIASIVIGVILLLLVIGLLYYVLRIRPRRQRISFRRELMVRGSDRATSGRIASWLSRYSNKVDPESVIPRSSSPYPEKDRDFFDYTVPVAGTGRPLSDLSAFILPYTYGSPKQSTGRTSRLTSITTTTTTSNSNSTIRFTPLTDRQMELENMIQDLQADLTGLQRIEESSRESLALSLPGEHDLRVVKIRGQIERLTKLGRSDWALGLTDDVPRELYQ